VCLKRHEFAVDEDFLTLAACYVAEGSLGGEEDTPRQVFLSFSMDEMELAGKARDILRRYRIPQRANGFGLTENSEKSSPIQRNWLSYLHASLVAAPKTNGYRCGCCDCRNPSRQFFCELFGSATDTLAR
jgi:hypothetical protein